MGKALPKLNHEETMALENPVIELPQTVGKALGIARLHKGYSLQDIADKTRVRQEYLKCIEEGNTKDLPAQVYALGFVKAYAKALDLDSEQLVLKYQQETSTCKDLPALELPNPIIENTFPSTKLIVISLALAAVLFSFGIYYYSKNTVDQSSNVLPAAHQTEIASPIIEEEPRPFIDASKYTVEIIN